MKTAQSFLKPCPICGCWFCQCKPTGSLIDCVNARELHTFLTVQTKFADWIKRRISEYDFIENQDFATLSQNRESGGLSIEYFISLDMAKELSMVERTPRGKQARQYFIECEKQLSGSLKRPTQQGA